MPICTFNFGSSMAVKEFSRCVRAFALSPVAFLRHTQQGLNFGQVRLHLEGGAQMGFGLDVVALKEEQNPEVGLSIQVSRFQGDKRLEFRNGEIGSPLVEVLLGQPGMRGYLVLIASRRLGQEGEGGEGYQQQNTEFFFAHIAYE